jgi:hypothetical protein
MYNRTTLLLFMALGLAMSAGCVSLAGRKAVSVVTGEKSSVRVISISDTNLKEEYHYVQVNRFTSDLAPNLPATLLTDMRVALIQQINESKATKSNYAAADAASGKPALVVDCQVLDFEEGSRLQRAATIGGTAHIIARFTIKDSETGKTLAVFNSRGFLSDSLNFGGNIDDAVKTVNLGVIDYLDGKLKEQ